MEGTVGSLVPLPPISHNGTRKSKFWAPPNGTEQESQQQV